MEEALGIGSGREDLLYFEQQTAALCGVHALNTLLQGPFFTEFDLSALALELNAAEVALMAEAGVASVDYQALLAEQEDGGGNVRADGMFSIQVLSKALEVWGLQAVPLSSPAAAAARKAPEREQAFIANLHEHWFTCRQLHGQWWNFNSVFAAPEPLSDFYVSAFLGTLQEQGYTLFVIQGELPAGPHPDMGRAGGPGRWVPPEDAHAALKAGRDLKQSGFLKAAYAGLLGKASAAGTAIGLRTAGSKRPLGSDGGGEDPELARAIAASLGEDGPSGSAGAQRQGPSAAAGGQWAADEDADLAAAIAASLQESQGGAEAPGASGGGGGPSEVQQEGEGDGAAAEAAEGPSLPELGPEPDAGPGVVEVAVRDPSTGQRHGRRFSLEESVGHVAAFAAAECGAAPGSFRLAAQFPRRLLDDLAASLAAAGVGNKQVLVLEKL